MDRNTHPEEDYVEGCHRENYMKPHVCPVATGNYLIQKLIIGVLITQADYTTH